MANWIFKNRIVARCQLTVLKLTPSDVSWKTSPVGTWSFSRSECVLSPEYVLVMVSWPFFWWPSSDSAPIVAELYVWFDRRDFRNATCEDLDLDLGTASFYGALRSGHPPTVLIVFCVYIDCAVDVIVWLVLSGYVWLLPALQHLRTSTESSPGVGYGAPQFQTRMYKPGVSILY